MLFWLNDNGALRMLSTNTRFCWNWDTRAYHTHYMDIYVCYAHIWLICRCWRCEWIPWTESNMIQKSCTCTREAKATKILHRTRDGHTQMKLPAFSVGARVHCSVYFCNILFASFVESPVINLLHSCTQKGALTFTFTNTRNHTFDARVIWDCNRAEIIDFYAPGVTSIWVFELLYWTISSRRFLALHAQSPHPRDTKCISAIC